MKKRKEETKLKKVLLTIAAILFIGFILLPLSLSTFNDSKIGNVAKIPIEGPITTNGATYLGQGTASSEEIVEFIKKADDNKMVKVILLEINSPGGSAVASDEIANAIKLTEKPTISLIRDVGASGGYWVASATDHIITNRMSITGSIGVISSYLEFSGLMEEHGVGYERLVAGENKDMGTPFQKLDETKKAIFQKKLDRIHGFFVEEIAANRDLSQEEVRKLATGEFYLGIEAFELGLVDQLGDSNTAEAYIKENYDVEDISYITYEKEITFLDMLSGVFTNIFFNIGEGMGSVFLQQDNSLLLM